MCILSRRFFARESNRKGTRSSLSENKPSWPEDGGRAVNRRHLYREGTRRIVVRQHWPPPIRLEVFAPTRQHPLARGSLSLTTTEALVWALTAAII